MKWTSFQRSIVRSPSWQFALSCFQRDCLAAGPGRVLMSEWTHVLNVAWRKNTQLTSPSDHNEDLPVPRRIDGNHRDFLVSDVILANVRNAIKNCAISARLDGLVLESSHRYQGRTRAPIQAPLTQMRAANTSGSESDCWCAQFNKNTGSGMGEMFCSSKELHKALSLLWSIELRSALLSSAEKCAGREEEDSVNRTCAEWMLQCMQDAAFYFPRKKQCGDDVPRHVLEDILAAKLEQGEHSAELPHILQDLRSSQSVILTPLEVATAMCTAATRTAAWFMTAAPPPPCSVEQENQRRHAAALVNSRALMATSLFLLKRVACFVDRGAVEELESISKHKHFPGCSHTTEIREDSRSAQCAQDLVQAVSKLSKYMQQSRMPPNPWSEMKVNSPRVGNGDTNVFISNLLSTTIRSIRDGGTDSTRESIADSPAHMCSWESATTLTETNALKYEMEKCISIVTQLISLWVRVENREELAALIAAVDVDHHNHHNHPQYYNNYSHGGREDPRLSSLLTSSELVETQSNPVRCTSEGGHWGESHGVDRFLLMLCMSFTKGLGYFTSNYDKSHRGELGDTELARISAYFGLPIGCDSNESNGSAASFLLHPTEEEDSRRIDDLFPSHSRSGTQRTRNYSSHLTDEKMELSDDDVERINAQLNGVARGNLVSP